MKIWIDLFDIPEQNLGILLHPQFSQYKSKDSRELKPESEQYWELGIHARDLSEVRDPASDNPIQYDTIIEYDSIDAGTFFDRYNSFAYWFEEEFPEAEVYAADFSFD